MESWSVAEGVASLHYSNTPCSAVKRKAKRKLPLPRKTWVINPVTRVKESGKKYARDAVKKNFRNELDES